MGQECAVTLEHSGTISNHTILLIFFIVFKVLFNKICLRHYSFSVSFQLILKNLQINTQVLERGDVWADVIQIMLNCVKYVLVLCFYVLKIL